MTWMLGQGMSNEKISYFDVLELLHFNEVSDSFVEDVARLVEKNVIKVITEKLEVEHYFLPVYREESQMMNIYSSPEKIIAVQKDKYVITEFLSRLGEALGTELVLIDLRAGVTEFSAPFLFDSRVNKFFISRKSSDLRWNSSMKKGQGPGCCPCWQGNVCKEQRRRTGVCFIREDSRKKG